MIDENDKKIIKEMIDESILQATEFQTRKRSDTPTDDLQVVNRKYVNLNGTRVARPSVVSAGQHYWSNQDLYPWWTDGKSSWFSSTGSVVSAL